MSMTRGGALCTWCQQLFSYSSCNVLDKKEHVVKAYVRNDSLPDLANLDKEASAGCPFCAELKNRIPEQLWQDNIGRIIVGPATMVHESAWENDLTPDKEGVWALKVKVRAANSGKTCITLNFDLFAHAKTYARTRLRMRRRPPFTDRLSPECIDQLKDWISRCDDLHEQCNHRKEEFWPTRVIDVGPSDGSVDAKLVLTSGKAQKYLALSHCWGQPEPGFKTLRTIASTVDAHMMAIPMESMPLNYQHAVHMTRALGYRYLWIDSICIHQDSAEDWAIQGSQMDKIYKCAWVTLAATQASMSEDGFLDYQLRDRMFSFQVPTDTPLDDQESSSGEVYAQFAEYLSSTKYEQDVEGSIWNDRGWTLQERRLARRVIHFSESQIFWECGQRIKSECGQPIGHVPISSTRDVKPVGSSSRAFSGSDLFKPNHDVQYEAIKEKHRLYLWWFQIVAEYNNRELTYPSDKLAAIAGLAKELNIVHFDIMQTEDQYLAGIWLGALADCLLWMSEYPYAMKCPPVYRAPSWSWAKWDGAVIPCLVDSPNLKPESNMIQYVSHDIELNSKNVFGGISRASLQLEASIVKVCIRGPYRRDSWDWRYDITLPDDVNVIGLVTLDGKKSMYDLESDSHKIFAMPVKAQKLKSGAAKMYNYSGLILRSAGEESVFERIGVFLLEDEYRNVLTDLKKQIVTLI